MIRTHILSKRCRAALMSALLSSAALLGNAQETPQTLPTTQLNAGIHTIKVMVAQTPQERQTGLMFRQNMGASEGMLFVFEAAAPQCFWMKNTLLPLSAAFIADDGRIINIEDMKPQTLDSHCAKKPARFVLEMNQGWFAKHGVKAGDKLGGLAPYSPGN